MKIFSLFKISYLIEIIINVSYIKQSTSQISIIPPTNSLSGLNSTICYYYKNNVHKFSLIFNKFIQDSETFLKNLFFFSFSIIWNKISLTILILFAKNFLIIIDKNICRILSNFFTFVLKFLKIPKNFYNLL